MKKILVFIFIISISVFAQRKMTPLMEALERKDIKKAIELINAGADLNTRDRRGETPLIEAAEDKDGKIKFYNDTKSLLLPKNRYRQKAALIPSMSFFLF